MSIELELIRLRAALNDAEWDGDGGLAAGLRKEIERLEMLQSMGETFEDTQAAYFSDETTETARAYFFAALELWKENALDDCTIEFIAYDCGKHLGGNET